MIKNAKKKGEKLLWSKERAKMEQLMSYLNGICMCFGCGCERVSGTRRAQCYLSPLSEGIELKFGT